MAGEVIRVKTRAQVLAGPEGQVYPGFLQHRVAGSTAERSPMLANVMRGGCRRGFVAMPEAQDLVMYLLRWIHFVAGITWIGLLYFFNFVNTPAMKVMDATARPFVTTTLLPRALAWFRHGAWVTVLAGLVMIYLKYWANGDIVSSNNAKTILTGSVLGVIMLANVWGIIWPNQKRIIEATAAKQSPDPIWARNALYASRTNFILSFPMLGFMAGATHFPLDWVGILVSGVIAAVVAAAIVFYVQKAWIFAPRPAVAAPRAA